MGVKMLYTYRQTDRQTYRPSDELGCRGAFAFGRRGGELKCYIHTYRQTVRHTDPLTKWVLEELSLLKIRVIQVRVKHDYLRDFSASFKEHEVIEEKSCVNPTSFLTHIWCRNGYRHFVLILFYLFLFNLNFM